MPVPFTVANLEAKMRVERTKNDFADHPLADWVLGRLVRATGFQPVRISPNGFKPFASGYSAKPACPLSGLKLTSNVGKENRQDNIRSPISEGQSAEMPHISRVNMQSAPRASYSFAGVTKRQCWRRVSAKRSYFLGRVSRLSFSSV